MRRLLRAGRLGCLVWSLLLEPVRAQSVDDYLQQSAPIRIVQINAMAELTEVEPDSWVYRTLASLRERLAAMSPNMLLRGERTLTRFEFAAALHEVLRGLDTGNTSLLTGADVTVLNRLEEEFRGELDVLSARVNSLQTATTDVEARQFTPNAKLDGSVVMALIGGGGCKGCTIFSGTTAGPFFASPAFGDALGATPIAADRANTSFVSRTTLILEATFTGDDGLRLRMRGATGQDISTAYPGIASGIGVLLFGGSPGGASFDGSTLNVSTTGLAGFFIDEIRYQTSVFSDNFRIFFGPRLEVSEYIDTNSFANSESLDFTGGLTTNNPFVTFVFFGPGAGFSWQISDSIGLRTIYLANNGGAATGDPRTSFNDFGVPYGGAGAGGLFGGEGASVTELEIVPGPSASLKLQYTHIVDQGGVLGALTLPSVISNSVSDGFGLNGEWAVTPNFALFGRYSSATSSVNTLAGAGISFSPISLNTWQVGFSLPDLFGNGNALSLSVAQPLRAFAGSAQGLVGPGITTGLVPSGVETDITVFYRFQINDRLSLAPFLHFITQPVNSLNSNGLTIGALRAVFNF